MCVCCQFGIVFSLSVVFFFFFSHIVWYLSKTQQIRKGFKTWSEFKKNVQSLWVTTWCGSELQRKNTSCNDTRYIKGNIRSASHSSHQLIATPTKDMDDMFLKCNKNTIYVLNTSYKYSESDMMNLFGSPAGRALNEITPSSIKSYSNRLSKMDAKSYTNLDNYLMSSTTNKFKCNNFITPAATTIDKYKKSLIFKSNMLAKKSKFLKFLEDEKCNKNSLDNLSNTNNEKCSIWRNQNQKSSTELYREAAQLLGLSCTLSDSCRCLDCQGHYFDCDDFDSYSDHSSSDELLDSFDYNVKNSLTSKHCSSNYINRLYQTDTLRETDQISNYESFSDLSTDESEREDITS